MAAWKQIVFAIVLLAVAAAAWVRFFPGAPEILARWGIEWADAATPRDAASQGGKPASSSSTPQTAVVTATVKAATINDRMQAIGTGRANATVAVTPYEAGRMTELTVASGTLVKAGQVIAKLDSQTEEIAVERAKLAVSDAEGKYERTKTLRQSNAATSVQLADTEVALNNARLAQRDAELQLERRSILAPISGVIGILPIQAGNYVTTQTTVATIDDRASIIVDFWVSERFAGAVKVGAPLTAALVARPGQSFKGEVSAVDNRLDEKSRTLRVQARIDNPGDTLRAGMSFQVVMGFPGDTYPSVDPLSVQWGTEGPFVWAIRDGKAKRTPVQIVQRNSEAVLVDAQLAEGDLVVTEGIHVVREGGDVLLSSATAPAAPAGSGS
ncbi:RND family efflux transporter MFP subunit [Mesorhizobium soli]|uniref:efflux RND transporter periplasmic adaptor subunit n=1 Tax=Pseudaminobacter soli (ex Li et al. 2025) TaxID=1295366 RepID=UPI002476A12C|nr:efflux RND transporter periplasmic adaptor subunit [Mesorhizobium soli]MDH6233593.1 RND family efflux transporter MFP subunit [Mesorhizobium soli]